MGAPGGLPRVHPPVRFLQYRSMRANPVVRASTVTASSTLSPASPARAGEFVNAVVGGEVPKEFIGPIDQGIQGAMKAGILAGYRWRM